MACNQVKVAVAINITERHRAGIAVSKLLDLGVLAVVVPPNAISIVNPSISGNEVQVTIAIDVAECD